MSSNGGGGSNLLDMGLMIAAGVAAPELAGAIAPEIMGAGGIGGAAVGAATGAGVSGLTAAATGQNVLRSMEMGALGGAATGFMPDVASAGTPSTYDVSMPEPTTNMPYDPINASQEGTMSRLTTGTMPTPAPTGNMLGDTNIFSNAGVTPSNAQLYTSAGINTLGALSKPPAGAYTPPNAIYTGGPLQKFKYDPNNYQPDVVKPPSPLYQAQYAEGGITSLAAGGNPGQFDAPISAPSGYTLHDNGMYTSSGGSSYSGSDPFAGLTQQEIDAGQYTAAQRDALGQILNHMHFAKGGMASGGISTLGSYSDGGRLLKGPGDGMSDSIPAMIGKKQEARLADGEFVVPADVVSGLGNGSTDAGAKHLYKMMDKVRHARTGRKSQAKQIKADKYVPA